ncbi:hypothetical protein [Sphingopyxis sp.]|uniref:hypothetical protein n=1 Tax=Sphingopyxis sp. TaxID=1908224 RepID=UPI0025D1287B|nr:hypothetical protein [Sphingopyxis sp.]
MALCIKALVPPGFMVTGASKLLTLQICADGSGKAMTTTIEVPLNNLPQNEHGKTGKADSPCAYSALSMASLFGAYATLLALELAFVLALGFAPGFASIFRRIAYLRPPLRGPPSAI